jgi:hypothetical protein
MVQWLALGTLNPAIWVRVPVGPVYFFFFLISVKMKFPGEILVLNIIFVYKRYVN